MKRVLSVVASVVLVVCVLAGEKKTEVETQQIDPDIQKARELLKKIAAEKEVQRKYEMFRSELLTRQAEGLYESGNYKESREKLLEALRLCSDHTRAKELLDKVEIFLGKKAPDLLKQRMDEGKVAKELAKIELDNVFVQARKLFEKGQYDEAILKFRSATAMAKSLVGYMDVESYLKQSENFIREAQKALSDQARREEELRRREAQEKARLAKDYERSLWEQRLKRRYKEAEDYFARGDYEKAADLARQLRDEVRDVEPKHQMVGIAEALRISAEKAAREKDIMESKKLRQEETERWFQRTYLEQVPQTQDIVFPPRKKWEEILLRAEEVSELGEEEDEEWKKELKDRIESKMIPEINLSGTPLIDAISFLRALTDVNIVADQELATDTSKTITMTLSNVALKTALDWICQAAGLKYTLKNHAVYISSEDKIIEDMVLKRYDVSDILAPIEDFEADTSGYGTGGSSSGFGNVGGTTSGLGGGFDIGDEDEEDEEGFTGEELVRFIMSMIEPPGGWKEIEEDEGF